MKNVLDDTLRKMLKEHELFLESLSSRGQKFKYRRAELEGVSLNFKSFTGYNFRATDFSCSVLRESLFEDSIFSRADFSNSNLYRTEFEECKFIGTIFEKANLTGVQFRDCDLSNAKFYDSDCQNVRFENCNLTNAHFNGAKLIGVNLSGTNLSGAHLSGTTLKDIKVDENTAFFALQCPDEGSFVAYKKACCFLSANAVKSLPCIVKLRIPKNAKRSSATSRKCRASKAVVLEIQDLEGNKLPEGTVAFGRSYFEYKVGETVYPDSWDDDRWNECSHGIHFFMTRLEAVCY